MNDDHHLMNDDPHLEVADLIPWYVNGTLGALERQKVESHLLTCQSCRDDLSMERRIFEGMAAEPAVEYMPAASLKRLLAQIDGLAEVAPRSGRPVPVRSPRISMPWKGLAAASLALVAVFGALQADRWSLTRATALQPSYRTVTSPRPRVPDEVIRAVFSPSLTLVDLQAILDESHLKIVSGPTEAGVYSLAATSSGSVSESLAVLRRNRAVRFAESTGSDDADPATHESP
ncbi:MAG TPA: zf-HC2 domain-containing protein [Candidatus Binataceae bacterium]|nr:zf-HC2 domain-containing protein [Candidatus Binataceae bacterium]